MTVTWDDLAGVIALTGDGHGNHIPGSPFEWEHGYIPLTPAAATSHYGGKVPKGWHAPGSGGSEKAEAPDLSSDLPPVPSDPGRYSGGDGDKGGMTGHLDALKRRDALHSANKAADLQRSGGSHQEIMKALAAAEERAPRQDRAFHAARLDAYASAHGLKGWYRHTSTSGGGADMVQVGKIRTPDEGDKGRYYASDPFGKGSPQIIDSDTGKIAAQTASAKAARARISELESLNPPKEQKQLANTWDDLAAVIDLAPALSPPVTDKNSAINFRPAAPLPPSPPRPKARPRLTPLTPMRHQTAKSLRKLAASVESTHPEMIVHQHLRDAARTLEAGNEEGAQRHLRAAIGSVTPQALMRHGIHTDDGHIQGKQAMAGIHRHLLLVKDIQDVGAKNRAALERHADEAEGASPSLPVPPAHPDPNAGYGPGALAQKPTARQPGGDQALNAPATTNSGGSDPAAADPAGPQPKGSKQFAREGKAVINHHARTWDELAGTVELVGPKGYEHGWIKADPGTGILTGPHPADRLTVTSDPKREARAMSDGDLRDADKELARRAAMLGKPGQLSRGHKAVVAERKRRAAAKVTAHARTGDDLAAAVDLARGTGKHPLAGRMSKAQLAQHLTSFHQRPAGPGPGQPTVKAMQARHAVLHRLMAAPGDGPGIPHTHGGSVPEAAGVSSFARTWDEVAAAVGVIDLSAETGRLAVTPALYGKPGGPGLYGVKNLKHSDYLEQIVQALMRKGMDKGTATAIARGDIRKWMRGGGKVTPEVRAAAGAAEAQEVAAQARAHAHARTWDDVDIELAVASR